MTKKLLLANLSGSCFLLGFAIAGCRSSPSVAVEGVDRAVSPHNEPIMAGPGTETGKLRVFATDSQTLPIQQTWHTQVTSLSTGKSWLDGQLLMAGIELDLPADQYEIRWLPHSAVSRHGPGPAKPDTACSIHVSVSRDKEVSVLRTLDNDRCRLEYKEGPWEISIHRDVAASSMGWQLGIWRNWSDFDTRSIVDYELPVHVTGAYFAAPPDHHCGRLFAFAASTERTANIELRHHPFGGGRPRSRAETSPETCQQLIIPKLSSDRSPLDRTEVRFAADHDKCVVTERRPGETAPAHRYGISQEKEDAIVQIAIQEPNLDHEQIALKSGVHRNVAKCVLLEHGLGTTRARQKAAR